MLGQGGDRQAGVDADVGRDRRAVADHQVLVAEDALARVDDAVLGAVADHRAAEDVGGGRDVERASVTELWRDPAGALRQPFGRLVGDRDEGRVGPLGILLGLQPHFAVALQLRPQGDRVVERLHHQQDDRAARAALRPDDLGEVCSGWRTIWPSSFSGRVTRVPSPTSQRVEQAHRVAGLAVGDGLDVGVGVGVDARGDRDPLGQVVGVVLGHP